MRNPRLYFIIKRLLQYWLRPAQKPKPIQFTSIHNIPILRRLDSIHLKRFDWFDISIYIVLGWVWLDLAFLALAWAYLESRHGDTGFAVRGNNVGTEERDPAHQEHSHNDANGDCSFMIGNLEQKPELR